jgi:ankyrin repeat protein
MLISCSQSGYITGTVKDIAGQPLQGVAVKIKGSQIETLSDKNGNYRINYVPGNFTLIFAKKGYTSFELPLILLAKEKYPAEEVVLCKLPKEVGFYAYSDTGILANVRPVQVVQAGTEFTPISGIKDFPTWVTPDTKPKFLLYGNKLPVKNLSLHRLIFTKDVKCQTWFSGSKQVKEVNMWTAAEKIPFTMKKYPGEVQVLILTPDSELSPGGYAFHWGALFAKIPIDLMGVIKVAAFFEVGNGLYVLASKNQFDKLKSEIVKGADINSATKITGMTPLMAAVSRNNRDLALFLLKNGAEVNQRTKWGTTAFTFAVGTGNMDMIKILMDYKADLKIENIMGATALHLAAIRSNVEVAKLLIDNGLDVNHKEIDGFTPLHFAAVSGHTEMVKLLLARGANVNAVTKNGKTAADFASERGHSEVLKVLQDKSAEIEFGR